MEYKKNHFRQILLFYFCKGESAAKATRKLRQVYGNEALKERQCRNWFTRFRAGDFSLKDEPHTGRPNEAVDDDIIALIEADPHISIRGIGEKLQVHFSTIDRHLQRLGYVKDHNSWVLRKHHREINSITENMLIQNPMKSNELQVSVETLENTDPLTIVIPAKNEPMEQILCSGNVKTSIQLANNSCSDKLENKKRSIGASKGRIKKKTATTTKHLM